MAETTSTMNDETVELATVFIGEAQCGMDILKIQEINKHMEMTVVPQSPEYVTGIMNLRGQIVTTVDLGSKLGLSSTKLSDESRNIIVHSAGEFVGLLVDRIGDVVVAERSKVELPPANIGALQGKFLEGVFKTENSLIAILDVEKVLENKEL